jgi:hypothetical protein
LDDSEILINSSYFAKALKKSFLKYLIDTYKELIKKVPFLKYSLVFILTIIILVLIGYYNLHNGTVFLYALAVLIVTFICSALSYVSKGKSGYSKFLLYTVTTLFVFLIAAAILGFASFIFLKKPEFYKRWFPDEKKVFDTTKVNLPQAKGTFTKKNEKIITTESKERVLKNFNKKPYTVSIQLSQNSHGYYKLYLNNHEINVLPESTPFNPRIKLDYSENGKLLIVTKSRDSCITFVENKMDSDLIRIVPNCL